MTIERISPADALRRQQSGAILIDVLEDDERAAGKPAGAIGVPLGEILDRIAATAPNLDAPILLSCAHGQRSLHAAMALQGIGYSRLASVEGGFVRWAAEGLPVDRGALDSDAAERYSRHLLLPEVGAAGQIQVLAVGTVEQVVDARAELQLRTEAVSSVEREGGEAGTRPQVLRDHIALAICDTMLVGHRAQQRRERFRHRQH